MSEGKASNGASNGTHTPSQRYLSTRGEDNDVRSFLLLVTAASGPFS